MCLPLSVYADEMNIAEEYGVYDTYDGLSPSAEDFLNENGITPDSTEGIMNFTPEKALEFIEDNFRDVIESPLNTLALITAVIIFSALSGSAADIIGSGCDKMYRIITVIAAAAIVMPTIEKCVENAASTIISGGDFMLCYVPVFSGICASAGNITSSVSYNMIVLMAAEIGVRIAANIIVPLISICMAMNIIEAINPKMNLSSVTELIKKLSTGLLGLIMTVFTGMLSVQSIVGASADTVGVKAAKFVVANLVPVVGGAVADAYTTMRSGLGMLRGATGAFGIAALAVMLLPSVMEAVCMYFAMCCGSAAAGLCGNDGLSCLFKGAANAMSLIIAVLCCFSVLFIISTIILMAAGLSAGAV